MQGNLLIRYAILGFGSKFHAFLIAHLGILILPDEMSSCCILLVQPKILHAYCSDRLLEDGKDSYEMYKAPPFA